MRSLLLPAIALVLLTSCSPDHSRRNNETGMIQGGADAGTTSPAAILSLLYVANTTEIQLARLAAKKASSLKVKQVAKKLAADHAQNREEELALAQKLNVTLTPAAEGETAAADSAALPPELQGKTGPDFDKGFVEHEIKEHAANIEKIQNDLLPAAPNAEMRAYLQRTLTAMQGHLAVLEQVQERLR
jgi:putative membrane protein